VYSNKRYTVEATLLAKPGSGLPSKKVSIIVDNYSFDFGKNDTDPSRGYWFLSTMPLLETDLPNTPYYYKINYPNLDMKDATDQMENILHRFFILHDFLRSNYSTADAEIECVDDINYVLQQINNEQLNDDFIRCDNCINIYFQFTLLCCPFCDIYLGSIRTFFEII